MFDRSLLISVIMLNYNGRELLETAMPSLYRQTFKDFEVILVDNGSTDDSLNYLKKNYPQVRVINSPKNNFALGNNLGIRASRGRFIFVLNNDVELGNDCLENFAKAVKNSGDSIGMWAAKILNFKNRELIDNTGLLLYRDGISRGRGRLEKDGGQYDCLTGILMPSGCAGVYKKDMLDKVGLFDEDFEFYGEDSDLGLRARLAGWKCEFVPEARVYHLYSSTLGKYSPQKAYLIERNRIWMMIKTFPLSMLIISPYFTLKRYLWQVYGLLRGMGAASGYSRKYSKLSLLAVLIKAWAMALIKAPKMIIKRFSLKKIQSISTAEVKDLFSKFNLNAKEISLKEY